MELSAQTVAQNNVGEAKTSIQQMIGKLTDIEAEQNQMMRTSWKGNSADQYQKASTDLGERFHNITTGLNTALNMAEVQLANIHKRDQS